MKLIVSGLVASSSQTDCLPTTFSSTMNPVASYRDQTPQHNSSRGQGNIRGLEASRPRPRRRTSKCVLKDFLEAKDVLKDSTSVVLLRAFKLVFVTPFGTCFFLLLFHFFRHRPTPQKKKTTPNRCIKFS